MDGVSPSTSAASHSFAPPCVWPSCAWQSGATAQTMATPSAPMQSGPNNSAAAVRPPCQPSTAANGLATISTSVSSRCDQCNTVPCPELSRSTACKGEPALMLSSIRTKRMAVSASMSPAENNPGPDVMDVSTVSPAVRTNATRPGRGGLVSSMPDIFRPMIYGSTQPQAVGVIAPRSYGDHELRARHVGLPLHQVRTSPGGFGTRCVCAGHRCCECRCVSRGGHGGRADA